LLNKFKDLGAFPATFVTDFESETKTATGTAFPHSRIQGCRFHLAQAWYRKMQQLGLAKQNITSGSEVGK
jgi:transposase-like protein